MDENVGDSVQFTAKLQGLKPRTSLVDVYYGFLLL